MLAAIDVDQREQVIGKPEETCPPLHLAVRLWLKAIPSPCQRLHIP